MRPEPTRPPTPPARRGPRLGAIIATGCVVACAAACGSADGKPLDTPVTASWSGVGLRAWAVRVTAGMAVPVVVDRRLDPDTPISLDCRDEPLRDVVQQAAMRAGGEAAVLASAIRIVPPGMARLLLRAERARDARLARLPAPQKSFLASRQPWVWPEASRPRDLVVEAAAESGISIEGIETLPHDHLPATSLPPLSLAERLDLVLADYDQRIEWRAGAAGRPVGRIMAIDTDLPPDETPLAESRPASVRRPAVRKRAAVDPRDTFSLQVAAPLEQVLAVIAQRLGLSLEIDRESLRRRGIVPGEIVKATVQNASREQLLDAILDPLQLEWTIGGGTLRVFAAPPK